MGVPQNIKNTTMSSNNTTTGMYPEEVRLVCQTAVLHAHCNTVHNSQDMEPTYK